MADKSRQTANIVSDFNVYVDAVNDRVGIGSSSPSVKLDVVGNAKFTGVVTASSFSGAATYATSSGIATYATTSGVSTSVIGGISSVTQLQVSGISTHQSTTFVGTGTSTGTVNQTLRSEEHTSELQSH